MHGEDALWLFGGAVTVVALMLLRPSSGFRTVLFVLLIAFVALMVMDMSVKGLVGLLVTSD
jgi:hypothetical protein